VLTFDSLYSSLDANNIRLFRDVFECMDNNELKVPPIRFILHALDCIETTLEDDMFKSAVSCEFGKEHSTYFTTSHKIVHS
jgi:hypothetical protein